VDERRFQRARLESVPAPRVIAFGSSRVMEVSTALAGVPPGQFYNAGMSAATVEDFIALWSILERQGKRPDAAWFSVDAWVLNEAKEEVRWLAWADEVSGFLARAGVGSGLGRPVPEALHLWYRGKELLSWTVLTASVADFRRLVQGRRRHGAEVQRALEGSIVAEAALGDRRGLRADGSIVYEAEYRDLPAERTREEARRYVAAGRTGLEAFRLNAERAARLELLVGADAGGGRARGRLAPAVSPRGVAPHPGRSRPRSRPRRGAARARDGGRADRRAPHGSLGPHRHRVQGGGVLRRDPRPRALPAPAARARDGALTRL
jgi:hypothetical protein